MNIEQIKEAAEVEKTQSVLRQVFAQPGEITMAELWAVMADAGIRDYLPRITLAEVMGKRPKRSKSREMEVSIEDRVLYWLDRYDDWACAEDIAEGLGYTQAYISATLARMERNPEDMRVVSREERVALKGPPTKFFKLMGSGR